MKTFAKHGAIGILALALVATACGGDDGGDAGGSDGGGGGSSTAVTVGISYEPATLDPQVSDSASLAWNINEGLVSFDENGTLQPLLAASLPKRDANDPTRWHVALREGVTFTDGTPFDAAAVKFNVERIIDPKLDSQVASPLTTIKSAEVVDDHDVDVITTEPDPILDYRLAQMRIVSPKTGTDYQKHPIGTGPYALDQWATGDHITLKENGDYWGDKKPQVTSVTFKFIPDDNTRLQALQAGDIDLAQDIPADQVDKVPNTIRTPSATNAMFIRLNPTVAPFDNVSFRRALAYAIDWKTINHTIANDQWNMNQCQPVIEGNGGFDPDLQPYPYDPAKAKELLSEVTIPSGFQIEFTGTTGIFPKEHEIQQAIASYWQDIGLKVDLQYLELDPFLREYASKTNQVLYNDTDQSIHHGARQLSGYFEDGSGSVVGHTFPDLDQAVEKAATSLDDNERQAAYDQVWKYACDNALFLYGLDRPDIWGARKGISYPALSDEFDKLQYALLHVSDS